MMRREDLRLNSKRCDPDINPNCLGHPRELTDAEFDVLARQWALERGWVEPPDCDDCWGTGRWPVAASKVAFTSESCPSCGGTGKQRMVAVGGIVRAEWCTTHRTPATKPHNSACELEALNPPLWRVATLEGETDE